MLSKCCPNVVQMLSNDFHYFNSLLQPACILQLETNSTSVKEKTRWGALMSQLEQQQHVEFVGGGVVVGWWLTPTTYIQLAGAGSISIKRIMIISCLKSLNMII